MNTKDLCATMVDSATGLNSAMEVYGFLKEELYQYLSMDPSMDAQKIASLNHHMERLIMAFEGFELAIARVRENLLNTVQIYEEETHGKLYRQN